MKEVELDKIRYVLDLNEDELSIMGKALNDCLFESPDFFCCENCRDVGIKALEKIFASFKENHKHS